MCVSTLLWYCRFTSFIVHQVCRGYKQTPTNFCSLLKISRNPYSTNLFQPKEPSINPYKPLRTSHKPLEACIHLWKHLQTNLNLYKSPNFYNPLQTYTNHYKKNPIQTITSHCQLLQISTKDLQTFTNFYHALRTLTNV